jgi:hypothetical protein
MMKMQTTKKVMEELARREYCTIQWQRPSARSIAACSGVSLSTAYRYLKRLVLFGLVDKHLYDYQGEPATGYSITNEGLYWLSGWKKLL